MSGRCLYPNCKNAGRILHYQGNRKHAQVVLCGEHDDLASEFWEAPPEEEKKKVAPAPQRIPLSHMDDDMWDHGVTPEGDYHYVDAMGIFND